MQKDEYLRHYFLQENHWWFVTRRNIILDIIDRFIPKKENYKIVDLGCCTGGMLKYLTGYGAVYGVDSSEEALTFCKREGLRNLKKAKIENTQYPAETFDLVLGLDILEHCDDDLAALREIFRICKKGGHCILTVPAYKFMFSDHDVAAHHKRRYGFRGLRSKFEKIGFSIIRATYFNTLLFPLAVCFRGTHNLLKPFCFRKNIDTDFVYEVPGFLNMIFGIIFGLEKYLLRILNLPFGLSLLCIAYKGSCKEEIERK
ncbi:MAG: class I SAM-dependent methyltransferase [Candidatus Omnitrophica bacterium]|nr:class I SAM-dependent methyltransferase [Candidatus Omnitrophota bacterium]